MYGKYNKVINSKHRYRENESNLIYEHRILKKKKKT